MIASSRSQAGIIHLLLVLVIIVFVGLVLLFIFSTKLSFVDNKNPFNFLIKSNFSKNSYKNPFDKTINYNNPFTVQKRETYKNPFEGLK